MQWSDIRKTYPNQWLIIEAIEAHTEADNQRRLDKIAVIETCAGAAMNSYRRLHMQYPQREFYFVPTSRTELEICERQWVGIRRGNAVTSLR
ncbi:MAG: hypothetical protein L0Z70_12985 [Chloroflexi bacterium]|nr:hypothetical protein [Chloroflexota bacterium]